MIGLSCFIWRPRGLIFVCFKEKHLPNVVIRYLHVYNLEVLDVGLYYRTYGHVEVVRHVTIRVEVCLYLCILSFISSCQWKIVCSWLTDTGVAELRLESCMISKPMK